MEVRTIKLGRFIHVLAQTEFVKDLAALTEIFAFYFICIIFLFFAFYLIPVKAVMTIPEKGLFPVCLHPG